MENEKNELSEKIDEPGFLAETALRFTTPAISYEIYDFIGQCLRQLNPEATVVVNSVNQEYRMIRAEAFSASQTRYEKIVTLLGFSPVGMSFQVANQVFGINQEIIQKIESGIHDLSFSTVPPKFSRAIEKLLNLGDIYSIAFMAGERMYANALILLPAGSELMHIDLIHAFVEQASVTLKRIDAERNEERYRSLFEFMQQGAFYQQADGHMVDVNQAALDMLGLSREEFLNKDPEYPGWHIIDENHTPLANHELTSRIALRTGKPFYNRVVGIYNSKKQDYVWAVLNAIPQFMPGESMPYRVFVTMHDITMQKLKDQELIRSEAKYKALVQQSNQALFLYDQKGNILEVNQAAIEQTGYPKEELLKMSVFDIDQDAAKRLDPENIWNSVEELQEKIIEVRHHRKDGTCYPAEVTLGKVSFLDQECILCLARDITERKAQEAAIKEERDKAQLYLDMAAFIFIIINPQGQVTMINRKGCEVLGYEKDEIIGKNWFDHFLPHHVSTKVKDVFRQIIDGNLESLEFYENTVLTSNNEERLIAWRNTILRDEAGNVTGSLSAGEDITEKRKAEEEIRNNYALLRMAGETTKFGGWSVNLKKERMVWSEVVARIHEMPEGYSPTVKEVVGFYAPEWQERIKTLFTDCAQNGKPFDEEMEIITAKGNRIWIRTNGEAVRDEAGRIIKVQGAFQDIHERKKADEVLKASMQKFKSSVDIMLDAFGMYNAVRDESNRIVDFRIDFVNEMACSLNQLTGEEQIGKRLCEILPAHKKSGLFDEYVKVVEKGVVLDKESIWYEDIYGGQLSRRAFDIKAIKFGDGFIASWRDITKRKITEDELIKSEARATALVSALPDLMFRLDHQGVILDYKASIDELYYQESNMRGRTIHEVTPKEFADMTVSKVTLTLQAGEIQEFEYQLPVPGKGLQDYEARMVPSGSNEVVAIIRNITAHKMAERRIAESEANARAIMEATHDVFILLDKNGILIDCNEAHARRLGMTRAEMVGKNVFDYLPADIGEKRKTYVDEVIRTEKPFSGEDFREGYWNEFSIYPVFVGGKITDRVAVYSMDITQKKKFLEALHESEQRYKELANSIADIFFAMDHNMVYTHWNKASELLTGIPAEEAIGKSLYDIFPDVRGTKVESFYLNALETNQPANYVNEYEIGGLVKSIDLHAYPSKTGLVVFAKDISDRINIEKSLKKSEEKFREFFHHASIGMYRSRLDGSSFIDVNANFASSLGYTADEMIGTSPLLYYAFPHDRERLITRLEKHGSVTGEEVQFVTRAGVIRDFIVTVRIDADHNILEGSLLDITERKQMEKNLKESERQKSSIISNLPGFVYRCANDRDWTMSYLSEACTRLTGYTPEDFIDNHKLSYNDIILPEYREFLWEKWQKVLEEKDVFVDEYRIIRADQEIRWMWEQGQGIYSDSGELMFLEGFITDITERKLAEEKLLENAAILRELNATKDKFFSIIAHDLKSPFNAIIGFSEFLIQDARHLDVKEIEDYSRMINSSANQTLQLLENLLSWARMQQGRLQFTPKQLVLNEIAKEVISLMIENAEGKNISLQNHIPRHIIVNADEEMLKTIIRNLFSNAVKFTHRGGKISITAEVIADEIMISVKDTGIGISSENIKKLFRIGSDFTMRGTNNEKGTGLGLILCRDFVERHGGRIGVESEVGNGSTFFFSLPVVSELLV